MRHAGQRFADQCHETNIRTIGLAGSAHPKKMIKPGGQIVMVDFKKAETPVGPPMEMRIDRDDLVQEMERNGFRVEAEHTFLPYQYFLVFKAK